MASHPHGAGKSSYQLVDVDKLFTRLDLKPDTVFLDLGCGKGDYALKATEYIGPEGWVYAVDLWPGGIEHLNRAIATIGIGRMEAILADAGSTLPLESGRIDVCLMTTVFHDLVHDGADKGALSEIHRLLKPGGTLAVVEFNKVDSPPGPPVHIRLSPDELAAMIVPKGFEELDRSEVGPHHYLTRFRLPG